MIRVLHISLGSGVFGGVARFTTNYYRHIDQNSIVFDFLFCNKNSLGIVQDDRLFDNSKVFELDVLKNGGNHLKNYRNLYFELRKVLRQEKYSIVHIGTGSFPMQVACLLAAKKEGVKVRIAHSHNAGVKMGTRMRRMIKSSTKPLNQFAIRMLATDYFACSIAAGENLFGKGAIRSPKFRLVKNAIETSRYVYDVEMRNQVRKALGADDKTLVLGHIGRFDKIKNHPFLIRIFSAVNELEPNSRLWIIGDGPERSNIENCIEASPAREDIVLTGERTDVEELLQGMDVVMLPSFSEGLSIVAIEAQSAGLPVFASADISREHNVAGNVEFLSLAADEKEWAKKIIQYLHGFSRVNTEAKMISAGYDIVTAAAELAGFYIDAANR